MNAVRPALIATTLAIGLMRIFAVTPRLTNIPSPELSYEAFAHLFVGGLFGAAIVAWTFGKWAADTRPASLTANTVGYWMKFAFGRLCLGLAISVSLLELAMFLLQKYGAL